MMENGSGDYSYGIMQFCLNAWEDWQVLGGNGGGNRHLQGVSSMHDISAFHPGESLNFKGSDRYPTPGDPKPTVRLTPANASYNIRGYNNLQINQNNGVRKPFHIGSLEGLSTKLRKSINKALKLTEKNTGMTVGVAFNYGGRAEILEAVCHLMNDGVPPQDIDEKLFGDYLYTNGFPEVDMVIRTGGEIRTSNFLIWQAAYSEYYFTPVLWPDFKEGDLKKALLTFSKRQRRFGGLQSKAICSGKES